MGERRTYDYEKYERIYAAAARRKKIMTALAVLMTALAILALVMCSQTFVLREVVVTGNTTRSSSEIAGLSGLQLGMNILSVDEQAVAKAFASSSYLDLLDVRVEMPDTVVLEVRERTVCAAVNCAGVILLIDEEGYILNKSSVLPKIPNLILVSGMNVTISSQGRILEAEASYQIRDMRLLLAAIRDIGAEGMISELNVSDQDNLYLVSQSGIQILLGSSDRIEEKMAWAKAVLSVLTQEGIMRGVLDVSTGTNAVYAER